jgi:hypothetical protein
MSYIGNEPTSVAFLTDTFSGNGSTTAFTLSQAPANTSSILVAISGVLQDPSTYSVSGTTLTFSPAPPTGSSNISVRFLGIPASGVTTTAYRTVTEFTATSGQTTFSVPSYTAGFIDVYRNGVMLGSADYTATNGVSVVLANGCTAGDLVEVISFQVSSVLNAIPATTGSVGTTYLADNSVTTAKIAAGAVVQADLATGVAGTGPAFFANKSSSTNVGFTLNTWTKVILDQEQFDTNSNFDSTTNYRFTPTVAGYYNISAVIESNWNGSQFSTYNVAIYKNGSLYSKTVSNQGSYTLYQTYLNNSLVYLNGSTDYIEMYVWASGGSSPTYATGASATYMTGFLARAA